MLKLLLVLFVLSISFSIYAGENKEDAELTAIDGLTQSELLAIEAAGVIALKKNPGNASKVRMEDKYIAGQERLKASLMLETQRQEEIGRANEKLQQLYLEKQTREAQIIREYTEKAFTDAKRKGIATLTKSQEAHIKSIAMYKADTEFEAAIKKERNTIYMLNQTKGLTPEQRTKTLAAIEQNISNANQRKGYYAGELSRSSRLGRVAKWLARYGTMAYLVGDIGSRIYKMCQYEDPGLSPLASSTYEIIENLNGEVIDLAEPSIEKAAEMVFE